MYTNLTDILKDRAAAENGKGITFINGGDQEDFLSYSALYDAALSILALLQKKGLKPDNELVFQLKDNKNFILVFWACILGGIVPVPLAIGYNDDHKLKVLNVWKALKNPVLITFAGNLDKIGVFAGRNGFETEYARMAGSVIDEADLLSASGVAEMHGPAEHDLAFIQFSSGSTGSPKGVMLTHKNLIANMQAISVASRYTADDSMMSWMPLTHDMGLIGFHLNPLFSGMDQFIIPTSVFVRNPSLWLDKASAHKVTILSSPNFGYRYLLRHCKGNYAWDLSHVRILYNGAEPISAELCAEFLAHYERYQLHPHAMCPVYGLAEASLAVTISELDDPVISLDVDRHSLKVGERVSVPHNVAHSVSFVNVGRPIMYCSVRVTADDDRPVEDGVTGHIQLKGANVTAGYYNNESETNKVFTEDGWLRTGDLGFARRGSLYVTGRSKDIIFINGQNYYPHDIERVAEAVEGIELNKIVVTGFFNDKTQRDEIVAFVYHSSGVSDFLPVRSALRSRVNARMGLELDHVIPVRSIPKTTSGKLQRFRLLQDYRAGVFNEVLEELNLLLSAPAAGGLPEGSEDDTESRLLKIWSQVLKRSDIGVSDNFFEIGGNSLLAAEMAMLIARAFEVELPPAMLYERPTIKALSGAIGSLEKQKYDPIGLAGLQQSYPLSSSQKRLYYIWKANEGSVAYNIPVAFRIKGDLDSNKLEDGLRQQIRRHDSLRMFFRMGAEPVLAIKDSVDFSLEKVVVSDYRELNNKLRAMVAPFDLAQAPLFRAVLLEVAQDEHILFVDFHHIIADGLSIHHLIDDVLNLYAGNELPAIPVQYKDYLTWAAENVEAGRVSEHREYWLSQLKCALPVLELPVDFGRPAIFDTAGQKLEFSISKIKTVRLKEIAGSNASTLHVLLLSLYNILLFKCSAQEEIIVGIPVAGRAHPDLLKVFGMFVNNLVIKTVIHGDLPFSDLLKSTKKHIAEALAHQHYPFGDLVEAVNAQRDVSRNPLFDTMFVYQNMGVPRVENCDLTVSRHFFDQGFSKFDLSFEIFDDEDCIRYNIEYATALFKRETIERFAAYFERLVDQVINNPDLTLSQLTLLSDAEYHEAVINFNATRAAYPADRTISQLFEEQVARTPGRPAVEHASAVITYGQLNNGANHVARALQQKGIGSGDVVCVLLERSPELITSILGVLKTGAAYLPIDPDLPKERISFLISDSRSKLVLADHAPGKYNVALASSTTDILQVDKFTKQAGTDVVENPPGGSPGDLAYIIYTSGTTGMPKGVMITQQSLVNYITWAAKVYCRQEEATFPLYSSISFDLTVTSIFTPLITGNRIVIYKDDDRSLAIEKVITDNKADIIKLTPSHLKLLLGIDSVTTSKSRVKRFIVGGEKLESKLARDICRKFPGQVELYNEYGPTEATVGCMIHKFDPAEDTISVPIGIPASNTHIYLLDKFLRPVPVGVNGELYIAGDGLASGYLYRDELTAEKFIINPFVEGQKMYKTGDFAKRLPPGKVIEYVGRFDHQIKIDGYRIELGEIEAHLSAYPGITEALVTTRTNSRNLPYICAYYKSDDVIEASELKGYLAARLPYYMIPVHFMLIAEIPLTQNGKVDHRLLPEPRVDAIEADNALPASDVEEVSLQAWKDVLRRNDIGVNSNFFELGGDSIKAVQISSRLFELGISLNAREILTCHTIRQTSLYATAVPSTVPSPAVIEGTRGMVLMESWFFTRQFINPDYYNQSVLLRFNKDVNADRLRVAFRLLVRHHDGLRINYNRKDGILFYNEAHAAGDFQLGDFELDNSDHAQLTSLCQKIKNGFDLEESLLLKAAIIRRRQDGNLLFITAHHLVIDGVSWRILLEDLYVIYHALENDATPKLPRKSASLTDWQEKLNEYCQRPEARSQAKFWDEIDGIDLKIPVDFVTDDWSAGNMRKMHGALSKASTDYLVADAYKTYKADVSVLLDAALILMLREWTGLPEFVVEMESHGRHLESIDVSRTIGWFTAMYPVRFRLDQTAIGDLINAIKEQIRSIPDQGIGYGAYRQSRERRDNSNHRLREIRFNYLGQFGEEMDNDLFSYIDLPHGPDTDGRNRMTVQLEFNLMIVGGILLFEINYNCKAHAEDTIERVRDLFIRKLEGILADMKSEKGLHLMPSDFDTVDLTQEELDTLFR